MSQRTEASATEQFKETEARNLARNFRVLTQQPSHDSSLVLVSRLWCPNIYGWATSADPTRMAARLSTPALHASEIRAEDVVRTDAWRNCEDLQSFPTSYPNVA